MKTDLSCRDIRQTAVAQLEGETSSLEKSRFAAHLAQCDTCRLEVKQMSDLMDAAKNTPFLPTALQKDAMFDAISSAIEPIAYEDALENVTRLKTRRFMVFLSSAAVVLMGMVVLFLGLQQKEGEKGGGALNSAHPGVRFHLQKQTLQTEYPVPNVALGSSPNSRWKLDEGGDENRILIERGTLWIRYTKMEGALPLRIVGNGLEARVIGTVLVVRAEVGRVMEVGVFKGRVDTQSALGSHQLLAGGDYRNAEGTIKHMSKELEKTGRHWLAELSIEKHNTSFSSDGDLDGGLVDKYHAVPKKIQPNRQHPIKSDSNDLYDAAEKKMGEGNYRRAAKLLETFVRQKGPVKERAWARLDLANLYARQLNRPSRAVFHLSKYLAEHPNGAKSKWVKKRLCALVEEHSLKSAVNCIP